MTYESLLLFIVAAGLVGAGFLLASFSEIIWYLKRAGTPGSIITDAAILGWGLWALYLALLLSVWLLGWPIDERPFIVGIGVGVAFFPWWIVIRWWRWRYGKDSQ